MRRLFAPNIKLSNLNAETKSHFAKPVTTALYVSHCSYINKGVRREAGEHIKEQKMDTVCIIVS